MEIKHPYAGLTTRLTVSGAVLEYVQKLRPEPKQVPMKERTKAYWKEQGIGVVKDKPGLVPAADYTDPTDASALDAVYGLYRHLKGTPISRHLVAVALNFQVSDDVDRVREALKERGVIGTDVDKGDRGRSVRWIGEGAVVPEKKSAAKKAAADETPAEGVKKAAPAKAAGDKTPPKGTERPAAPAGSRPAKRAAEAAAKAAPKPADAPAQAS